VEWVSQVVVCIDDEVIKKCKPPVTSLHTFFVDTRKYDDHASHRLEGGTCVQCCVVVDTFFVID